MAKYDGYDYTEITASMGLREPEDHELETPYSKLVLAQFSNGFFMDEPTEEDNLIVGEMREFLSAVIEAGRDIDYHTPVLEGILAVEDDETFVKVFALNLGIMWN